MLTSFDAIKNSHSDFCKFDSIFCWLFDPWTTVQRKGNEQPTKIYCSGLEHFFNDCKRIRKNAAR